MEFFETFQLNLYAIAVLSILLVIVIKQKQIETYGKRLLLITIILTIAATINEPISWEFDGSPSTFGYTAH